MLQSTFGKFLLGGPKWLVPLVLVVVTAGAAAGAVLSEAVGGQIVTTVGQALEVRDIQVSGAAVQIGTISDDGTRFSAAAEQRRARLIEKKKC